MSVSTLRKAFLDAVDRHVPQVRRQLVSIARSLPPPKKDERGNEQDFDALLREDGRFAAWADRWGFADSWLRRIIARNTAYEIWQGRGPTWLCGQALLMPADEPFQVAAWSHDEMEAMFRKRADGTIRAYVKTRKREWIQSGLEIPRIRAPQHFEDLALVHVKGLSYKQVADLRRSARGIDENTVRKGVLHAAAQIGLTLRPPKVGRPRKKPGNRKR